MHSIWWIPLFVAIGLACIIGLLHLFYQNQSKDRAVLYRRRYLDLVGKVEKVTFEVNQLASLIPAVKTPQLWEYYESCLKLLENLLVMFQKLEPFGRDLAVLNSAHFLMKDCQARVARTRKAVMAEARGKKIDLTKVYGHPEKRIPTGCYFCSRPFVYSGFSRVRARIDDEVKHVYSCDQCANDLKRKRKVKVLYFMRDGKAIHWSEMNEYSPIHDFWNINRKTVLMKSDKLEIEFSNEDRER